ncbi:ketosteroid isomerase-like protein [Arthrobacter sp. B3I9]|uniref:nuclear transport factor 2 family protein n=1 Tax=Arthrobacter sp. B3I9 TaxID=3042270 RepID=UPI002793B959|nr:nuclear transport factor 2 family protein [Arthrobacter sp. B3I9]MDQ0850421.1 ketosteroid isomerase-like protein [Arthrobacter sp. B3I9]
MGAGENVELVRRGYEAFNAGDMDTLRELFAEDAVWFAPGNGTLSGRKEGRERILAYFRELGTRSEGQLKVTLQDTSTARTTPSPCNTTRQKAAAGAWTWRA